MKTSRFPDSLVLLFALIIAAQILSIFLTPGRFERVKVGEPGHEREQVVPGSFAAIPEAKRPSPSWFTAFTAVPKGMMEAADIIFFVFIIGGAIGIIHATGAINAMLGSAVRRLGKTPALLVGGTLLLFGLGSATIGMSEEYVPFIPLLVTMCLALRMDAVVAIGLVYVGAGVGYGCSPLNPFTVIIAQDIAGLQPASGQTVRWLLLILLLAVGFHHVLRYALRVRRDPASSLVSDIDYKAGYEMPEDTLFTRRRAAVIAAFVAVVLLFIYGIKAWGWYLEELSAVFMGLALAAALLGGLGPNRAAREFVKGAKDLTGAALLIGFARGIQVVLQDAMVIDTVINGIANLLSDLPSALAAIGMFLVQSLCNFFIPSGSGQAYVTMPIMAPLADLTGVTRQVAVLAYQFGDGFTNMIVPTNALLMGMLALGRVPYQRWFRFIVPLLIKIYVIAGLALVLAVVCGYK